MENGMSEKQITVIIKEPGQKARAEYLFDNNLKAFQAAVGGRIETLTICTDLVIVCNADSFFNDLPFNCNLFGIDFYGTILFVGTNGEEFASIKMRNLDDLLCSFGM